MEWLKDCSDALVAMAERYGLVQILDLQQGKFYSVKSDPSLERVMSGEKSLQEQLAALLAMATVRGSHQEVAEFIDLSTLANRLHSTKRISLVVQVLDKGWYRLDFIRMGEKNPVSQVIFAIENITSQKEHEGLMQQTVDLLAECYSAIYYVNVIDHSVQPVRMNDIAKHVVFSQTQKLTPRALMKTYIDSYVHPDDAADMMKVADLDYLHQRLTKEPYVVQLYRTRQNGIDTYFRLKIMKLAQRPILVCAFENIDKETREKNKTAHEREQYNMLINGLSREYSSVWYIDATLNLVSLVRSNTKSVTTKRVLEGVKEVSYEMAIQNYIDKYVVPEDRKRLYHQTSIAELLKHIPHDGVYRIDYARTNLDGKRCHFQACYARDVSIKGTPCFIAGFRDVQSMFMAEQLKQQELAEARQVAEAANAAKTNFLFNMSHDIRTPMNAIMGFRDLLEKHQNDAERCRHYLTKIKEASKVLLSIINNVLEMARIEKGILALENEVFNIYDFAETIYSVVEELMKANQLVFSCEVNVQHKYFYGDTTKLREVFLNILSNACKYTAPGGSVRLLCEELPGDKAGWGIIRTTISDTGIGMSEDFLPHVFDEFSRENNTTSTKIEGTGLGMSIVKKLVNFMDGTIEVTSKKGKGTTFVVSIPHRFAKEKQGTGKQQDEPVLASLAGISILLAEDNEINAEIAMTLLQEAGMRIERAENGKQCVELLVAAPADTYDLILMDVQMPQMNGYEAARAIRALPDAKKAGIPILAMTANAFAEDRQEAFAAGMNGHIAKPIEMPVLLRSIAALLDISS
ncbi:Signal transduction histidine kinase [Selenomonas sp. WCT3]|uniref:hybrid sensor histidine kinase/response regulator n=1 Tax=Selenomonas sp. WCT3 TaxID=3158785 RepID=UPI000890ABF5|nr:Signal transduction histidine kinase [Selenomonas ruminantium]